MASSINASTTAGVVTTADTSGVLNIQTAGVTAISIDASQAVSFTNSPTVTGGTANGVAYLNGSKVLTTGSALVFDGTNLRVGTTSDLSAADKLTVVGGNFAVQRTSGITTFMGDNTQNGYAGTITNHAFTLLTNSVERLRLNTSGTVILQGASTSATGVGITFPATQSASTDANTLDDYEEGSWTPSLGGTSTGTFTGKYVKVGKLVTLYSDISVTLIGTGSTTQITGIPFTATSGGSGSLTPSYTVSLATAIVSITAYVDGSTIYIASRTAAAASGSTNAIFGNGTSFSFLCTYIATA